MTGVSKQKRRVRSKTFQKSRYKLTSDNNSRPVLPTIIQLDRQCAVHENWIVQDTSPQKKSISNKNSTLLVGFEQNTTNLHTNRRSISFQLEPLRTCEKKSKRVRPPKKSLMHELILKIVEGQFSLPDLMDMHSAVTVIKILKHKRMHQNAGWFQSFVNSKDSTGDTALHIAAKTNRIKLTKILLKYNALENVLDKSRMTPLDLAVTNGHFKMCLLLLKTGSILGPTMYENDQILEYCDREIVQLLKSYNQPAKQMQIGLLSSPTKRIYVPPLHMYEVPFEFKSEQNQLHSKDYNISEHISNVSSTPTRSARIKNVDPYNHCGDNANNFFDSFLDFH